MSWIRKKRTIHDNYNQRLKLYNKRKKKFQTITDDPFRYGERDFFYLHELWKRKVLNW